MAENEADLARSLGKIEGKLDGILSQLNGFEYKINKISNDATVLEKKVSEVEASLKTSKQWIMVIAALIGGASATLLNYAKSVLGIAP